MYLMVEHGHHCEKEGGGYVGNWKTANKEVEIAQVRLAHDASVSFLMMELVQFCVLKTPIICF